MSAALHSPCITSIQRGADGWSEITVRSAGRLVAVITHPCAGADWFVHKADVSGPIGIRFKTRKAVLKSLGAA